MGLSYDFGFMPYGERWKERRKIFHQEFNTTAAAKHRPAELSGARDLLGRLLDTPNDFMNHLRQYALPFFSFCEGSESFSLAGSVILSTTYGIEVQPVNDPFLETAEVSSQAIAAAGNAGSFIVDFLPWRKSSISLSPALMSFICFASKWSTSRAGARALVLKFKPKYGGRQPLP